MDDYPPSTPNARRARSRVADPVKRLERMDEYGVQAQVLYPNVIALRVVGVHRTGPRSQRQRCAQAYNDFIAEFASDRRQAAKSR